MSINFANDFANEETPPKEFRRFVRSFDWDDGIRR
jgi:hypothetical protein